MEKCGRYCLQVLQTCLISKHISEGKKSPKGLSTLCHVQISGVCDVVAVFTESLTHSVWHVVIKVEKDRKLTGQRS